MYRRQTLTSPSKNATNARRNAVSVDRRFNAMAHLMTYNRNWFFWISFLICTLFSLHFRSHAMIMQMDIGMTLTRFMHFTFSHSFHMHDACGLWNFPIQKMNKYLLLGESVQLCRWINNNPSLAIVNGNLRSHKITNQNDYNSFNRFHLKTLNYVQKSLYSFVFGFQWNKWISRHVCWITGKPRICVASIQDKRSITERNS